MTKDCHKYESSADWILSYSTCQIQHIIGTLHKPRYHLTVVPPHPLKEKPDVQHSILLLTVNDSLSCCTYATVFKKYWLVVISTEVGGQQIWFWNPRMLHRVVGYQQISIPESLWIKARGNTYQPQQMQMYKWKSHTTYLITAHNVFVHGSSVNYKIQAQQ